MARKAGKRKPPKRAAKRAPRPTMVLPSAQRQMPAGFLHDGKPATLNQVVSPHTPTVDGPSLDAAQRAALTVLRIKKQARFAMASLRHGLIDKKRAIKEVQEGTPLGRALVDIEHIAIDLMRREAERRRKRALRRTRR